MRPDPRLTRLDANRLRVENPHGIEATLFAREGVPVEPAAVGELVGVLDVAETAGRVADHDPDLFGDVPEVPRVSVTPDFHKGAGVPIGTTLATRGFVVPAAIGNDVNCGMRLHVTDLDAGRVPGVLDDLETNLRRVFFEAGRSIPMTRPQRDALFRRGLTGLLDSVPRSQSDGLWADFHDADVGRDLEVIHGGGTMPAEHTRGLVDFLGPADGSMTRDGQIGSIGGGNHFVEIQRVDRVLDGPTAHAWGLKVGRVVVMVHSGSLTIGHHCGMTVADVLRHVYPPDLTRPDNGLLLLPEGGRHDAALSAFWDAMSNAANFAFANRLFLALMALRGLREVCGELDARTLYDAPHNLVWREEVDGRPAFVHRKGSCPARGYDRMADTPFAYYGEPVLVPGSMGASSFVLAGRGNAEAMRSASHGAGRAMSRGDAMRGDDAAFGRFLEEFRVVTPLDLRRADVKQRPDIVAKKLADLKKEAPFAYKGIGPVVETLEHSGIAQPVAELTPLLTVKG